MALKLERRFYGCELKDEYIVAARINCTRAVESRETQLGLFQ